MSATVSTIAWCYIGLAAAVSVYASWKLERRLKQRCPKTRPFKWGYYVGCMGVACLPPALLFLIAAVFMWRSTPLAAGEAGEMLGYAIFFGVNAVSGWFILQRKRWAWVLGTIFACNLFVWIINWIYGKNRWAEFEAEALASKSQCATTELASR